MIIYKETINNFLNDIYVDNLVSKMCLELEVKKGIRPSEKEKESWKTTLIRVSRDIENIENKNNSYILLEFVLPNHKKRIDVILIGSCDKNDNLVIIELKGWSKINLINNSKLLNANTSYSRYGLSHPAYEVKDYFDILKNEYSSIEDVFNIFPIAYLPNYEDKKDNILISKTYEDVMNIVSTYWKDNKNILINFLKEKIKYGIDSNKVEFLNKLEYRPSISFLEHAKNKFENIKLIGSQRNAFEIISYIIDQNKKSNKQTAFIISGPAGSGKSIIAFKLLNKLIVDEYNTRLMIPGIEFRNAVKEQFGDNFLVNKITGAYSRTKCDYVIIDEAHKATANGTTKQFYNELLRYNKNVILFLDDFQVINKKGITKSQFIDIATTNYNFDCVELELEEQFRNGGDYTYIDWLKKMIFNADNDQYFYVPNKMDFKIYDGNTFNEYYQNIYDKQNVRLVSFWTQRWDTKKLINDLPVPTVKIANYVYTWNPNNEWLKQLKNNNKDIKITKQLYDLCEKQNFINDKKGFQYVAYFNTIQGSEFDYIFVHIPKLFFLNENNQLDVDFKYLLDENNEINEEMRSQVWSIKNIKNKKEKEEKINLNKLYFKNRLFICLTRGTKGTYVYFEDKKLEKYFSKYLK